ncbi:polyribonucleotide nucleotidyltransferase [Candidatus Dependentiae bacterium]|nr:MAG: polyribonucleotide nucleotidyltransferase [Candidatus Dependentiae bacterium]
MTKKFTFSDFGYEVELNTFAQQASGSVWIRQGGTIVLATVVSAPAREFPGFLPLTVEYRELFSAAGKIPGGYFKREGRPTDKEILTSRLIDRALRPLFSERFFDSVQIIATVYSVDKEHVPGPLAMIASSLALTISKIPFLGPVGVVELAYLEGSWVINPIYAQSFASNGRLFIAGTDEGVSMVEGSLDELPDNELVNTLFLAHEKIKKLVAWQKEIQQEVGIPKEKVVLSFDFDKWERNADKFLDDNLLSSFFISDKIAFSKNFEVVKEDFINQYAEEFKYNEELKKVVLYIWELVLKRKLREIVLAKNKRLDGRAFNEIRPIWIQVGILPFVHGSALFTRGRTQALVSVTLGGGRDEQKIEGIMGDEISGSFMLHYNFPPFAVGEARPLRGPGRREIGHGHLAAGSFTYILPDKEKFPYTIRVVSDILESNGSSSMATVCGSTMALMDAGVPIKKMVSGIAMGLLCSKDAECKTLSDITGFEDSFGLMDFKVAGTDKGVLAIQLDIKYKGGLTRPIFEKALEQAREGRLYILEKMRSVMSEPRSTLSELVPKLVNFKIGTDKIGTVIGPRGKTIRDIIEKTSTDIDIGPDGQVKVFGAPGANIEMAVNWIKTLVGDIEKGARYHGKIRRFVDFGIFVELVPGQDGLVHISNIPRQLQKTFMKHFKLEDVVLVEVVDYDPVSGKIRLRLLDRE